MKCQGLTRAGQPCGVPALRGEDRCLFHSDSETAVGYRKRSHDLAGVVSRKELLRIVTKDFRDLATKSDEKSQAARLRLAPLLSQLINETQQLGRLKKLAREKGLI